MSSTIDQLASVLPVIVMGGVAMKMTQGMFQSTKPKTTRKRKRSKRARSMGFGNFGNVGF